MDRKAIIVVSASVAFILLWMVVIVPKYFTKPAPPRPATASQSTTPAQPPTTPATGEAAPTGSATEPAPFAAPAAREEILVLTNETSRYTFTSHGGGLKLIELTGYPESTAHGIKSDTSRVASLNTKAPVPAMALLGDAAFQGDGQFALSRTATGVRA